MHHTPQNDALSQADQHYYLPTFKRFPIAFERGYGSRLVDVDGKEYIDLLAGIAVCSVGHCHPKVVAALKEQADKLWHVSNFFVTPPQVKLARKLTEISGLERVFFTNSGAESVEGAIKIARKWAHNNGKGGTIVSMEQSFHGRTLATIATGQKKYQQGFAPIPEGFKQIPFNDVDALENALSDDVAAVLFEVVQGEGGIRPAAEGYLEQVRELCDRHGVLLILDEIQAGIGRTGQWFAWQHEQVKPDIMTLAKGLGGGFPIGAFMCSEKVSDAIDFGDHGTTFGGNALACAASLATLDVIESENLAERATVMGEKVRRFFSEEAASREAVKEVRGRGLMLGVVLHDEAKDVVMALLEEGVVANATAGNVLRLVPPLNIPESDLDTALGKIDKCLLKLHVQHAQ